MVSHGVLYPRGFLEEEVYKNSLASSSLLHLVCCTGLPLMASPDRERDGGSGTDSNGDYTKDGTVDFNGRPFLRSKGGRWTSFFFILVAEVFERIAYYGIASNMMVYLTEVLQQGTTTSAKNVNNWMGTMMMTPIVSAFIADACLGQYWASMCCYAIYLLGLGLLTATVSIPFLKPSPCHSSSIGHDCSDNTKWFQIAAFYCSIYIMALGVGGTKVNLGTLGANQFDKSDPRERAEKASFFNWWSFAISFGNLFSTFVVVYIQESVSWSLGYAIATISLAISMTIFGIGAPLYRHKVPSGSPFTKIAKVLVAAIKKWRVPLPRDPGELHELDEENYAKEGKFRISHTASLRFLDKSAVKIGKTSPWMLCSVTEVEQTKKLIKLLPVFSATIMPSVMIAQVLTLFIKQGMTLDNSLGPHFNIPPASLSSFFILGTITSLAIYDRWFVPFARHHTSNPRGITLLQRIGIGLFMQIITMFLATMIERWRLSSAREMHATIFILLPQFVLMGVSETFVSVGKLEFFYDQAPEGMKSLGTSFYSSSLGIGSFISGFLLSAVSKISGKGHHRKGWIHNNLNESHLDYYYAFLTVLSVVNFLLFLIVSKSNIYSSDVGRSENEQEEAVT